MSQSTYQYPVTIRVMSVRHQILDYFPFSQKCSSKGARRCGNVTVQLRPHVRERLNIRRVKPYKQPTPSALDTVHQDQPAADSLEG